jgi:cytosine/adenosine deaminase-related metal-dependent hydrolase
MRSVALAESVGWIGDDVWFAHAIFLDDAEIRLFARTGTGVAHCPSANMRCGQGIAKIRQMLDAGVPVGLGVDGTASNDTSNMFLEARMAQFLQLATRGGARLLGRDDIGYLAPGMSADFIAVDMRQLAFAGAQRDPLAALIMCGPFRVDHSFINGRHVVDRGVLQVCDLDDLLVHHAAVMTRIYEA